MKLSIGRYFFSYSITRIMAAAFFLLNVEVSAQSPYKLHTPNEYYYSAASIPAAVLAYKLHADLKPLTVTDIPGLNRSSINSFDRNAIGNWSPAAADWSDGLLTSIVIAPLVFLTDNDMRRDAKTLLVMYSETIAANYFITEITKSIVQRSRPFTYDENFPISEKLTKDACKSFFSGHASTAFASSMFISTVYDHYFPDSKYKVWIYGASFLTAAGISYLRYEAGMHFPTDLIVGAVVGSAIGYFIPYIHQTDTQISLQSSMFPASYPMLSIQLQF